MRALPPSSLSSTTLTQVRRRFFRHPPSLTRFTSFLPQNSALASRPTSPRHPSSVSTILPPLLSPTVASGSPGSSFSPFHFYPTFLSALPANIPYLLPLSTFSPYRYHVASLNRSNPNEFVHLFLPPTLSKTDPSSLCSGVSTETYATRYQVEMLSPPYMDMTRPTFSGTPTKILYGKDYTLTVSVPSGTKKVQAVVIDIGYSTHGVHMSQVRLHQFLPLFVVDANPFLYFPLNSATSSSSLPSAARSSRLRASPTRASTLRVRLFPIQLFADFSPASHFTSLYCLSHHSSFSLTFLFSFRPLSSLH
jgi:hypothetical protein